jgi:hypothetical protein
MSAVQSMLTLLTKYIPEPVKWIASSDPISLTNAGSYCASVAQQDSLAWSLLNTQATYAAMSQNAMAGNYYLPPMHQPIPVMAGMTMTTPFGGYPSVASADGKLSTASSGRPIVIPPDKAMGIEGIGIPWAW